MMTWEFVLRADDDNDLSDPANGQKWFNAQPWMPTPPPPAWGGDQQQQWRRCVLALRSLAKRLKRRQPRHLAAESRSDQLDADVLFRQYLNMLRLRLDVAPRKRKRDESRLNLDAIPALSAAALRGLRVVPTVVRGWPAERMAIPRSAREHWYEPEVFWQCVFYSLVAGEVEPVCGACGSPLDPTPQGRPPRRKYCKRCQYAEWRRKQSPERMRKKWRQDKRRQH
jgi:hypothetical protein